MDYVPVVKVQVAKIIGAMTVTYIAEGFQETKP
jgi:hypothetical protein